MRFSTYSSRKSSFPSGNTGLNNSELSKIKLHYGTKIRKADR